MTSAKDAHGELYKLAGIFVLAFISIVLSYFMPSGYFSKLANIKNIPCLGLGIFSGVLYIFWIALAREMYGRGYGILVSAIIVSLLLINGPWYGVVDPPYFGVFGFLSFILMGIATDFINGGVGSVLCLITNWIAFGYFKNVYPKSFPLAVLTISITFFSGFIFDFLAKKFKKYLISS